MPRDRDEARAAHHHLPGIGVGAAVDRLHALEVELDVEALPAVEHLDAAAAGEPAERHAGLVHRHQEGAQRVDHVGLVALRHRDAVGRLGQARHGDELRSPGRTCMAIRTWVPKPFSLVSSSKDDGRMRLPGDPPGAGELRRGVGHHPRHAAGRALDLGLVGAAGERALRRGAADHGAAEGDGVGRPEIRGFDRTRLCPRQGDGKGQRREPGEKRAAPRGKSARSGHRPHCDTLAGYGRPNIDRFLKANG